jgi:hypothetical protein
MIIITRYGFGSSSLFEGAVLDSHRETDGNDKRLSVRRPITQHRLELIPPKYQSIGMCISLPVV